MVQLETKRLLLRPPLAVDAAALYPYLTSEAVNRFNVIRLISEAEYERQLESQAPPGLLFHLVQKETKLPIGTIKIWPDPLRYGVAARELSFWLGQPFFGQGFMTEALSALLDRLFFLDRLEILMARVFVGNAPSRRLLLRLGFQSDGHLRRAVRNDAGVLFDEELFSLTAEDWSQKGG